MESGSGGPASIHHRRAEALPVLGADPEHPPPLIPFHVPLPLSCTQDRHQEVCGMLLSEQEGNMGQGEGQGQ